MQGESFVRVIALVMPEQALATAADDVMMGFGIRFDDFCSGKRFHTTRTYLSTEQHLLERLHNELSLFDTSQHACYLFSER